MIYKVTVTNYVNETITFDLMDPEKSGFIISSITGITPVKGDINVTDLTTTDGGVYNSSRIPSRNIVLKIVYLPNPTIEASRQLLYKYFPTKKKVTLQFETENRNVKTEGFVESNSVQIFTQQEFSTISIICPDPYFYSAEGEGTSAVSFAGIMPVFEFPFWSDETVDPMELIEFSTIETANDQVLTHTGDLEIGATIAISALNNLGNVEVTNKTTNQKMSISSDRIAALTGEGIRGGDVLSIITDKGKKAIKLYRGSKIYNLLNALDRNSQWITVVRGDNVFSFSAKRWDAPDIDSTEVAVSIMATVAYEGV